MYTYTPCIQALIIKAITVKKYKRVVGDLTLESFEGSQKGKKKKDNKIHQKHHDQILFVLQIENPKELL